MQKNVEVSLLGLKEVCSFIFKERGIDEWARNRVCDELILNQLTGYASHGLLRIPEYIKDIDDNKVVGGARPIVKRNTSLSSTVEGNKNFGILSADGVAREILDLLENAPVAIVALKNSHHIGRLASIARQVLSKKDAIIIGFCNYNGCGKKVALPVGGDAVFATNPLLYAFSTSSSSPFILDMTTSNVAEGKVRNAWKTGSAIENGWLQDIAGQPSNDAEGFFASPMKSFLTPLGGRLYGHKGIGLGLVAEVLASCLTGAGNINAPTPEGGGNSGVFISFSPLAFGTDGEAFKERAGSVLNALRASGMHIPGSRVSNSFIQDQDRIEISSWFTTWLEEHLSDERVKLLRS